MFSECSAWMTLRGSRAYSGKAAENGVRADPPQHLRNCTPLLQLPRLVCHFLSQLIKHKLVQHLAITCPAPRVNARQHRSRKLIFVGSIHPHVLFRPARGLRATSMSSYSGNSRTSCSNVLRRIAVLNLLWPSGEIQSGIIFGWLRPAGPRLIWTRQISVFPKMIVMKSLLRSTDDPALTTNKVRNTYPTSGSKSIVSWLGVRFPTRPIFLSVKSTSGLSWQVWSFLLPAQ